MSAEMIAGRRFAQSWRGYDTEEVKEFLSQVAVQVRALKEKYERAEVARREAEQRASHPEIDEATLMAAVGEETAAILRSARSAANEITNKAEQKAQGIVEGAEARAAELVAEAESLLSERATEAESVAREVREHALAEADHLRDLAQQQASAITVDAEKKSVEAIQGAQAIRERILSDLARRRKLGSIQVEQLRAGRERLLDAYLIVRRTLDEVTDELQRADAEARAAADAVGHQHGLDAEELVELHAEEALTRPSTDQEAKAPAADAVPPMAAAKVSSPLAQSLGRLSAGGTGTAPRGASPAETAKTPSGASSAEQVGGTAFISRPDAIESVRVLRPSPTSEPAGPPPEPPDASGANGHLEGNASQDQVQDLFARIRAGRAQAATGARKALYGSEDEGNREAGPPESDPDGGDELREEPSPTAEGAGPVDFFARRDQVTARLESSLARKLKRALQDEQNSLLDKLRNHKGPVTAAAVLPSPEEQPDRFVDAGRPVLEDSARAGSQLVAELYGEQAGPASAEVIDDLAEELGRVITEPLRQRLELAFQGSSEDASDVADALGPAYREWKTQRIEAAAHDQVAAAFARGVYLAFSPGSSLCWLPDPRELPCPDCEDNALAGAQLKGESWPTGQLHPPAHPGCRCAVAPPVEGATKAGPTAGPGQG